MTREPQFCAREDAATGTYKPLGQVLLEKRLITAEKLDEALSIHWRRGVLFGEILRELSLVSESDLANILASHNTPALSAKGA
jgi:hypothetical protein